MLVPALLQNLLDANKYDINDEEGRLNIISATRDCLISIAEAIKERFLDYAVKFIGGKAFLIKHIINLFSLSHKL